TIRQWTLKFGQTCANTLRRKQAKRGDKWLLDEVAGPFARDERAPAVESGLGGGGCHLRVGRATVGHAGEGRACRRVGDLMPESADAVAPLSIDEVLLLEQVGTGKCQRHGQTSLCRC